MRLSEECWNYVCTNLRVKAMESLGPSARFVGIRPPGKATIKDGDVLIAVPKGAVPDPKHDPPSVVYRASA